MLYIYRCPTISPRNVPFLLWAQVGNSSSQSDELQPLSTGLDLRFEGKCEVASVDASKHHRMDINDTPGSIPRHGGMWTVILWVASVNHFGLGDMS